MQPASRRSKSTGWVIGDSVDAALDAWGVQESSLDFAPDGIVSRLGRVRTQLEAGLQPVLAAHDLSAADFAVVMTLRRAGPPYRLPQGSLLSQLGLTSGTVSVRLTRLVAKRVVTRTPSEDDARGTVVTLTARGVELFERVAPAHLHTEDVLLSALTGEEREQLTGLLRRLLVGFEQEQATSPLGLMLAPAHLARRMRTAVGLSDTPGLLVTQVLAGAPAADAGVQVGDLLVALDGAELRSGVLLAQQTARAAYAGAPLSLEILRGTQRIGVTVQPAG